MTTTLRDAMAAADSETKARRGRKAAAEVE